MVGGVGTTPTTSGGNGVVSGNGNDRGVDRGSVRSASYVTSTPNSRQSAPNILSSMADTNRLKSPIKTPSAAIDLDFNIDTSQIVGCNDLTAEIDLSDDTLGVAPIHDSHEDTPMFCTPRTNSRIVRIISKQSNV